MAIDESRRVIPDDFIPHKSGDRYDTEEDRQIGHLIAIRKCSAQPWTCGVCNVTIRLGNRTNHKKSVKHKRNSSKV